MVKAPEFRDFNDCTMFHDLSFNRTLLIQRQMSTASVVQPVALVQTRGAGEDEGMQRFVPIEDLFKGRHFDRQIIVLCVSWYTSFKLSLRDLVIMMADRGISVTHTTILRWVQRYLPEFEKRWRRYARPVGGSWRMDETYSALSSARFRRVQVPPAFE